SYWTCGARTVKNGRFQRSRDELGLSSERFRPVRLKPPLEPRQIRVLLAKRGDVYVKADVLEPSEHACQFGAGLLFELLPWNLVITYLSSGHAAEGGRDLSHG